MMSHISSGSGGAPLSKLSLLAQVDDLIRTSKTIFNIGNDGDGAIDGCLSPYDF